MLPVIIHLLEITTLALVVLAAIRVKRLAGAERMIVSAPKVSEPFDQPIYVGSPSATNDYEQKMKCLKLAQAFAGNQLLEIKRELYNLNTEQPEWLRQAVGLYLIGAIDFIGKKNQCETNSRAAKSWLETKLVPDSFRLQTRVQDWGALA